MGLFIFGMFPDNGEHEVPLIYPQNPTLRKKREGWGTPVASVEPRESRPLGGR
jgi:hypothetical protein